MFTQRKSFFKGKLFYIILLVLFAFGLWLNQPIAEKSPEDVNAGTDYTDPGDGTVKQGDKGNKGDDDILDDIIEKNQPVSTSAGGADTAAADDKTGTADQEKQGYYLVKEVDGVIKIFYYDEEGKESLIRETDIAFSLLSVADQTLFRKGVIRHNPDELDELLQDFES